MIGEKMIKTLRVFGLGLFIVGLVMFTFSTQTSAANNPNLTQSIASGSLVLDIRDASRNPVSSPAFGLSALTFSFSCQTSTGVLGSNTQRIYIDNPGAASNGWVVNIAATAGATSTWANTGATKQFDFNDPTTAGCTDGADADTYGGQLTLNASAGTLTADCTGCNTTNITKGASASYNQGTVDTITLLNASSSASPTGRWYLTDVGVSQTIPAEQGVDNYSINLTATIIAS